MVRKALKTSTTSSPSQSEVVYPSSPPSSSSSSSSPSLSPVIQSGDCRSSSQQQGANPIKWINYGSSLPPKRAYKRTAKTQISPSSADGKKRKWVDYSPRCDGEDMPTTALVPQMPPNGYPSLEMELLGGASAALPDVSTPANQLRKRSIQLDTILEMLGKNVPQPSTADWGVVPQPIKKNIIVDETFLEAMGLNPNTYSVENQCTSATLDVSFPTAHGRRQSIQLDGSSFLQYLGVPAENDAAACPQEQHCVPSNEATSAAPEPLVPQLRRRSIQLDTSFFEFLGKQMSDQDRDTATFPPYAIIHCKTAQEEHPILVTPRKLVHDEAAFTFPRRKSQDDRAAVMMDPYETLLEAV